MSSGASLDGGLGSVTSSGTTLTIAEDEDDQDER